MLVTVTVIAMLLSFGHSLAFAVGIVIPFDVTPAFRSFVYVVLPNVRVTVCLMLLFFGAIVTVCVLPKSTEVSHVNDDTPLTAVYVALTVEDLPRASVTVTEAVLCVLAVIRLVVTLADVGEPDRSSPLHEYDEIVVPADALADAVSVTVDASLIGLPDASGTDAVFDTDTLGFHVVGTLTVAVTVCVLPI